MVARGVIVTKHIIFKGISDDKLYTFNVCHLVPSEPN